MGCGQSKINLYPRRNKNGGKGNGAKKSGAADKDADEEEGAAAAPDEEEDPERGKQLLPLAAHPLPVEISVSQQDFFKMLDERIEKGKDYDSSSETEIRLEHERRRALIQQWRSASRSSQSSLGSPPAPARRARPPARCCRPPDASPRHVNGDAWRDDNHSPVKRPQSAGANWKNNPKQPYNLKPKKNEANENQRVSSLKSYEQLPEPPDGSQITYNPTFQSHSPARQPYITQLVSYPESQQVTPPATPRLIAPPEEYQDKEAPPAPPAAPVYYIHGSTASLAADLQAQRQQTAVHLQQYVAMKQAQQQMFTYMTRGPHSVLPHEARAHSAPAPVGVVRPMPAADWALPGAAPWPPPELQYYPQAHYTHQVYCAHSAGAAGTLTRYHKDRPVDNRTVCQSISLVRHKPVGQIVVGGELAVSPRAGDSPSPAASTDSGVSPGAAAEPPPATPAPIVLASVETKIKKNKVPFSRPLKNSKSLESS
ncbi:uncharacterized protein LOC119691226 [Plutella xylostella]|uniref:uncharacterized protein LOC119691226 n=1 Tax=Plutella xylostella TaxID=51655 RepID=UPI00203253AB|nr:uncharacterized protein LOC119691226 [Plutella xylostella]